MGFHKICRARALGIGAVCMLAGAIAGCSTPDPLSNDLLRASIASGTSRKSVCIISAIGDTYSLQKVGVTVFGNALDKFPIDAWGVDNLVAAKISAQLGQRFEVKRIDYPKCAFASLETPKSPLSSDYKDYKSELRDIVRGIVASQKCDLCVVVTKAGSAFGGTNQVLSGLGIVDGSNPFVSNVHIFALLEMRVYEGQTSTVLAYKRAAATQQSFTAFIRGPYRTVDKSWWPAPTQLAQNAKLKAATLELVQQSTTIMVAELFPPQ